MTTNERRLTKRLDEMEKRIKELEAQPREQHHHHYPAPQPIYVQPYPWYRPWWGTTSTGTTITTTPNDGTTWYAYSNSSAGPHTSGYITTANGFQS